MKSIKQQYIDLREGNMSQANFMRNLRMTLPQYVTNVTSFEDSVRILKNKGILTEADEKGKWTNTSGKGMYDQFSEINNLNGQEVLIGIDAEMERNHKLTKEEATKIVIKNLKKNPIYYTAEYMSGVEGYEPEYIGGKSAQPEARQMQYLDKNMGNVVDKKMGMQPVKNVEKPKKDSNKGGETNKAVKGIELMSLIAKTVRGMKKMDATGEKMKKIAMKEARMNDAPGETPGRIAQQIATYVDSNPTLRKYSDEITLQSNPDGFLKFGYWDSLPSDAARALELQFDIKEDSDFDEDTGTLTFYRLTPKSNAPTGDIFNRNANITAGLKSLTKDELMEVIRKELNEITGAYGGDDMVTGDSYMNENELSPKEQKIADDILNAGMLEEGMFDPKAILNRIIQWGKKGLLTVGIVSAVLSSCNFGTTVEQDIKRQAENYYTAEKAKDDYISGRADYMTTQDSTSAVAQGKKFDKYDRDTTWSSNYYKVKNQLDQLDK